MDAPRSKANSIDSLTGGGASSSCNWAPQPQQREVGRTRRSASGSVSSNMVG